MSLAGKVAVVTGAAGLLGRQHALALAEAGAHVVATDLDERACAGVAAELPNGPHLARAAELTDPSSVDGLRHTILSRLGRIDVLVNNAAIDDKFEPASALEQSRFESYPLERFRRSLEVNVTGPFLCCQRLGAWMAEHGGGSIVNVASTYGVVAPDQSLYRDPDGRQRFFKGPAYPVSKGAVVQLTRFLAAYWGDKGVRVNTLSPGGVENGQDEWFRAAYAKKTPLGRMAKPGDYRGALVFLASDASAYVTGQNLVVDGGFTCW